MKAAPISVGLLFDFPQADSGASFEKAVRLGVDQAANGRLDRHVEFTTELARGLPAGSAREVERAFASLERAGVLCIVGPSISDNGLIVRHLAKEAGVACINYTGGEQTRNEWMFHYQVGSLEEEPAVLAEHLKSRRLQRVGLVYDQSPVGRGYAEWFEAARVPLGIEVTGNCSIPPLTEDARAAVESLAASNPEALAYFGLGVSARAVALALAGLEWDIPVVANSALMFGYAQPTWRDDWAGWVYVDTVSDHNVSRRRLRELSPALAAGPIGVAAFDIGRLVAEGILRSAHLTRPGIREGLERVKRLPATSGYEGTTMGFGRQDHGALKGGFLVLRHWKEGRTVEYEPAR